MQAVGVEKRFRVRKALSTIGLCNMSHEGLTVDIDIGVLFSSALQGDSNRRTQKAHSNLHLACDFSTLHHLHPRTIAA